MMLGPASLQWVSHNLSSEARALALRGYMRAVQPKQLKIAHPNIRSLLCMMWVAATEEVDWLHQDTPTQNEM